MLVCPESFNVIFSPRKELQKDKKLPAFFSYCPFSQMKQQKPDNLVVKHLFKIF